MWHLALGLAAALAGPAQADDWTPLTGAQIGATLTGRTIDYDGAHQVFHASGRTLYDAGRPSWGYWRVEGDRYCSQWPPSDLWACYDVARIVGTGRLRFLDAGGHGTDGTLRP